MIDFSDDRVAREARDRALRFIRYRPRSRLEIRDKLRGLGYDQATVKRVESSLESMGLIDDLGFARSFADELIRKGYGYIRIKNELLRKKINSETVEEALCSYPHQDEEERAFALARDKNRKLKDEAIQQRKRKIMGYLQRRGFSTGTSVSACVRLGLVDTGMGRE